MLDVSSLFDLPWVRFATSGTLIGLYALADWTARRFTRRDPGPPIHAPPWVHGCVVVSVLAFYALIGARGGSLAGGWGNGAGVAAALGAMALRVGLRDGTRRVRYPATAARLLFYAALPPAVGVTLGWAVLTLPAFALSAYCSLREDRLLASLLGETFRKRLATSYRWIPGIW